MSRIYEALQKAQREQGGAPELPDFSEPQPGAELNLLTSAPDGHLVDFIASLPRGQWTPPQNAVQVREDGILWEPFRKLGWHIRQLAEKAALKSLLITSAGPGEGKTFVAANLSAMFARRKGSRTLVINADLRRPKLAGVLGAQTGPGLGNYLRGEAQLERIIQRSPEMDLYLIAAGDGGEHPGDLLHANAVRELMDKLRPAFDWIFVDSPAAMAVGDASELGSTCDGVLMVTRAGVTPRDTVKNALSMFPKKVIGIVLNGMDPAACSGHDYSAYLEDGSGKDYD